MNVGVKLKQGQGQYSASLVLLLHTGLCGPQHGIWHTNVLLARGTVLGPFFLRSFRYLACLISKKQPTI